MNSSKYLVYTGQRPFKISNKDDPIVSGDVIDSGHPYWKHASQLLGRTDFEEIDNG